MGQSGTKLVIMLAGLALMAGATSWWYRYEAAHRATVYWGADGASLIGQPAQAEIYELTLVGAEGVPEQETGILDLGRKYQVGEPKGLTNARGMVHLRHALMGDRNFVWDAPVSPEEIDWRWCLRFYDSEHEVRMVLAADLSVIGRMAAEEPFPVEAFSCRPMAESLRVYFEDLGFLTASTME